MTVCARRPGEECGFFKACSPCECRGDVEAELAAVEEEVGDELGPAKSLDGAVSVKAEWECWTWLQAINSEGYGVVHACGRQHRAHRLIFELVRGPVPEGLVLDHVCRNRACVNPSHLEPVTNRENNLRGVSPWAINARRTACAQGHPYTPENTRYDRGRRYCLECKRRRTRDSARKRRARERAA